MIEFIGCSLAAIVFWLLLYGAHRMASWESRLIIDWLEGTRTTPPPNSAFFPQNIARQWWIDYEAGRITGEQK